MALTFGLAVHVTVRQVAPAGTNSPALAIDHEDFIRALKPKGQGLPIVAVLASNVGTETTEILPEADALLKQVQTMVDKYVEGNSATS